MTSRMAFTSGSVVVRISSGMKGRTPFWTFSLTTSLGGLPPGSNLFHGSWPHINRKKIWPIEKMSTFSVRFCSLRASSGDRHWGLGYCAGKPHGSFDVVFQRRMIPMLKSLSLRVPPMLTTFAGLISRWTNVALPSPSMPWTSANPLAMSRAMRNRSNGFLLALSASCPTREPSANSVMTEWPQKPKMSITCGEDVSRSIATASTRSCSKCASSKLCT
mmetsp:Transcript_13944/g.39673  ORF Transcript_13944/g.39673 Transcript_13944/m.39673 type:complete len:218 (-) Transcript_13944:2168-2821(-)